MLLIEDEDYDLTDVIGASSNVVIEGFIEMIAEHQVEGWAFNRQMVQERLRVTVRLDGIQVGSATADISRKDLKRAGYGDGKHGFQIIFEKPVLPNDLPRLEIDVENESGRFRLKDMVDSNHSMADQASNPLIPVADDTQHPVFILGPARSGTSALTLALLKSGRYEGFGEGHLLPVAHHLLRVIESFYGERTARDFDGTFFRSVAQASFQRMIRRGFIQLSRSAFPTGYWVDKTPSEEMVLATPLMQEVWPNARFIFLRRRVIEYLLSRRRKFPHEKFDNHVREWTSILTAWRVVRASLGSAAMELDQLDLATDGEATTKKITEFLGMSPSQSAMFYSSLVHDRPEQTAGTLGSINTIHDLKLDDSEAQELYSICGSIMDTYGYSFGDTYYKDDLRTVL